MEPLKAAICRLGLLRPGCLPSSPTTCPPVWLKPGAKLEDFADRKTVASRKVSPTKRKRRRRGKPLNEPRSPAIRSS